MVDRGRVLLILAQVCIVGYGINKIKDLLESVDYVTVIETLILTVINVILAYYNILYTFQDIQQTRALKR
jgi:hypothetical protein